MNGGSITSNTAITIALPPPSLAVDADSIPLTLRGKPRWVVWQGALRDGKVTKNLHVSDAPTEKASIADLNSWTDFATAMNTYAQGNAVVVGIVLTGDRGPS